MILVRRYLKVAHLTVWPIRPWVTLDILGVIAFIATHKGSALVPTPLNTPDIRRYNRARLTLGLLNRTFVILVLISYLRLYILYTGYRNISIITLPKI